MKVEFIEKLVRNKQLFLYEIRVIEYDNE